MSQPQLHYLLKGRLGAVVCDEGRLPLAELELRVYLAVGSVEPGVIPASQVLLSDEAVQAKAERLLGVARTDAEGVFHLELHARYGGQALELDLCIEQGRSRGCGPAEQSGQAPLCVIRPDWKQGTAAWEAEWDFMLPRYGWCRTLGICQAQTVCGRVVDCHTQQSIAGVRVAAFGLDWNQDQALGQAVTDSNGRFLIHTKHSGFRRVKAVVGSSTDSYDLYFRIQSQASAFPLYVDSIRWGDRSPSDDALRCLQVSIFVETDLARLREESRVASFLALTGSQSVLGLKRKIP